MENTHKWVVEKVKELYFSSFPKAIEEQAMSWETHLQLQNEKNSEDKR